MKRTDQWNCKRRDCLLGGAAGIAAAATDGSGDHADIVGEPLQTNHGAVVANLSHGIKQR